MSKIICDICGTSYQETAKQCPICGSVRPGDVQRVTNEIKSDGNVSTGYTYIKGGRFSKSNVKKRNQGIAPTTIPQKATSSDNNEGENKSNRGLVITAVVLLLAIIGIVTYIAIHFFAPISRPDDNTTTTGSNIDLSCTDLRLDTDNILLEQAGEARLLYVEATPANTTDLILFRSGDETVATVNEVGKVTAVGAGTTTIYVTCGQITKECTVTCQFEEESSSEETGDTTEDTSVPDETTLPAEELRLNRSDITFAYKGESWVLYSGNIALNLITFTSEDESVVTFVNGKAVAVGHNPAGVWVHAEYEDQKASCLIRCVFKENNGVGGNGSVSEDGGGSGNNGGASEDGGSGNVPSNNDYAIYTIYGKAEDITISVGESYTLSLKDSAGNAVEADWSASGSGCTLSGSTVTGAVSGQMTVISATYNGATYTCYVRVN